MYYSIGEISKKFDLPISTLRYYDKMGLFPKIERENGIRKFSDYEVNTLYLIDCLKRTGLEIKDIKEYLNLCKKGNATIKKRRDLFLKQEEKVKEELKRIEKVLDMIKFKKWYYDMAIKLGSEEKVKNLPEKKWPKDIKKAYKNAHS